MTTGPLSHWAEQWNALLASFTPERHADALFRLMRKVVKHPSGCWTRNEDPFIYTAFALAKNATTSAHKASWLLHRGPLPIAKLCVLHKCAVKACINPDHLYLGTYAENSADAQRQAHVWRDQFGNRKFRPAWLASEEAIRTFLASPPPTWLLEDRR